MYLEAGIVVNDSNVAIPAALVFSENVTQKIIFLHACEEDISVLSANLHNTIETSIC